MKGVVLLNAIVDTEAVCRCCRVLLCYSVLGFGVSFRLVTIMQGISISQCATCNIPDDLAVAGNVRNAYSIASRKMNRIGKGYGVSLHNKKGKDEKYHE